VYYDRINITRHEEQQLSRASYASVVVHGETVNVCTDVIMKAQVNGVIPVE